MTTEQQDEFCPNCIEFHSMQEITNCRRSSTSYNTMGGFWSFDSAHERQTQEKITPRTSDSRRTARDRKRLRDAYASFEMVNRIKKDRFKPIREEPQAQNDERRETRTETAPMNAVPHVANAIEKSATSSKISLPAWESIITVLVASLTVRRVRDPAP